MLGNIGFGKKQKTKDNLLVLDSQNSFTLRGNYN